MAQTGTACEVGRRAGSRTHRRDRSAEPPAPWTLIDGWLRVEYQNAAGTWIGATRTGWHSVSPADAIPPTNRSEGCGSNPVHPNAILILQELAPTGMRTAATDAADSPTTRRHWTNSQYSWYPINFFDPREGFPRDASPCWQASQCYVNGIMNAVELDVGNLNNGCRARSRGTPGRSTADRTVTWCSSPTAAACCPTRHDPDTSHGRYGFEDVINSASPTGTPMACMETAEDADQNGLILDRVGCGQRGKRPAGTGATRSAILMRTWIASTRRPAEHCYRRAPCVEAGRWRPGNLPVRPDNGLGGFTVAAENPVYVLGELQLRQH